MPDVSTPSRRSTRIMNTNKRTREQSHSASDQSSEGEASDASGGERPTRKRKRVKKNNNRTKATAVSRRSRHTEEVKDDGTDHEENYLYEALMDPECSIDTLVADHLDAYQESKITALTDLVNCILRCSGVRQEITTYDIEDTETVHETLGQLQDHVTGKDRDVVRVVSDTYPLVSKDKSYKGYRKQLQLFWQILIQHAADRDVLFDTDSSSFFPVLESWLVSMSSSSLRSFRHTATFLCYTVMTALVELYVKLEKDLTTANKQLETENKKKKPAANRVKTLESTIETKTALHESLKEMLENLFDGVFVHRYRDIDPRIRSESIHELGLWMVKLPSIYFEGTYLRYIGWVLSDTSSATRLEVVRALTKLYSIDEFASGLRHFTERFKARILEVAVKDAETNIRCAALSLVERLRARGFLEDEEIDAVLICIFDADLKVREAARDILHGVLDDRQNEMIDERLGGQVDDQGDFKADWIGLKVLTQTLSKVTVAYDNAGKNQTEILDMSKHASLACPGRVRIAALTFLDGLGKDFAVDTTAEYLLCDKTVSVKSKKKAASVTLQQALSLSDIEESMLLEVLVASIELALKPKSKAAPDEETVAAASQAVIDLLPQLLSKFTSPSKLAICLQIVSVSDASVFPRLRKQSQLEQLLTTVNKIFFGHQDEVLLKTAASVFLVLSQEDSLSALVKDKLLELQDQVRDVILQSDAHSKELYYSLFRLELTSSIDDCILSYEDAKADITMYNKVLAYMSHDNEEIRHHAYLCLRDYFLWKVKQLLDTRYGLEKRDINDLLDRRSDVLAVLNVLVDENDQAAAEAIVELDTIFLSLGEIEESVQLTAQLDENVQSLIMRALQKEMKRYARVLKHKVTIDDDISSDDSDEDEDMPSQRLQTEHKLCVVAGEVVRALIAHKIDQKYASLLTQNKGKLGPSFDAILKELDKRD